MSRWRAGPPLAQPRRQCSPRGTSHQSRSPHNSSRRTAPTPPSISGPRGRHCCRRSPVVENRTSTNGDRHNNSASVENKTVSDKRPTQEFSERRGYLRAEAEQGSAVLLLPARRPLVLIQDPVAVLVVTLAHFPLLRLEHLGQLLRGPADALERDDGVGLGDDRRGAVKVEDGTCRKYPSNMPKSRKISVKFP